MISVLAAGLSLAAILLLSARLEKLNYSTVVNSFFILYNSKGVV